MIGGDRVSTRKMVAGFAAAMMLLIGTPSAKAGPIDELNRLGAQASPTGGSVPDNLASPVAAPVTKFSATGRISEILSPGGCANNPFITGALCSPSTNCDNITMTGQVSTTSLGKATLDACYIVVLSSSLGECLNGLGKGTLTAANGNLINIAFGGDLCLADELLGPPVSIDFNLNLGYAVEGGTGSFLTETGNGNLTASDIIVNPSGSIFPGTGEFTMTGTLSKN
jgi:hypothetical protein